MTVCVAAIYAGSSILGASDRMLTSGDDIEFQPEQSKLYPITKSIVAMISGDMALQMEIYLELVKSIHGMLEIDSSKWMEVRVVAEEYGRIWGEIRNKRSYAELLQPLGLDHNSFISRQKEFDPDIARQMTSDLITFSLPNSSVIITGIDEFCPHIYAAHNGNVTCQDAIGFAAIGIGASQAQSTFMFNRYAKNSSAAKALYLAYAGKKRAEVVAGVGPETDFFVIGPKPGTYDNIHEEMIDEVTKLWTKNQKTMELNAKKAEDILNAKIDNIYRQRSDPVDQKETPKPTEGMSQPK